MKSKTLRQSVFFKATPAQICELLLISKKHSAFTGSPAKISTKVGGPFTAFDGHIEGTHVEIFKGRKIVQRWRTVNWPKGHYSTATWTFRSPDGGGCTMDFVQEGVPLEHFNSISQGWEEKYWEPMAAYFKEHDDDED